MENQPKLNSSKEVIAFLAERFPHCFSAEGEARPLKIGIFQDLVERVGGEMNLSKTQLRSAFYVFILQAGVTCTALSRAQRASTLMAIRAASWKNSMSNMRVSSLKKPKPVFRRSAQSSKRKNAKLPRRLAKKKTRRDASVNLAR